MFSVCDDNAAPLTGLNLNSANLGFGHKVLEGWMHFHNSHALRNVESFQWGFEIDLPGMR